VNFMKNKCDCGSAKCGHPGHSHWCSSLKEDVRGYDLSAALESLKVALNVGITYSYPVLINGNIQTNHSPNGNVAYNPSLPIYATPSPATPSHVFQLGDMARYPLPNNCGWSHPEKIYSIGRGIGRNGEDLIYFFLNTTMMVFHASELMFVPPNNQTVQNAP
jgi:hypothetical protein